MVSGRLIPLRLASAPPVTTSVAMEVSSHALAQERQVRARAHADLEDGGPTRRHQVEHAHVGHAAFGRDDAIKRDRAARRRARGRPPHRPAGLPRVAERRAGRGTGAVADAAGHAAGAAAELKSALNRLIIEESPVRRLDELMAKAVEQIQSGT